MNKADEKQTEEASGWNETRLRQLVENVEDYAIFITDLEGRIETWNHGAEWIFGYSAEEVIGQQEAILFTPEDRKRGIPEQEMQTARETGSAADERWHLRKDGSRFFASGFQTALFENGKLTGYAKIARDLTERVEMEERLHEANESLERKVGERTSSLQKEIAERKTSEGRRIELLRKIVRTQEDERKRISRDLHDHLGQKMTALKLNLAALKQMCAEGALCEQVDKVQSIADSIDSELDFYAWELRPTLLDNLGLEAALKNFVEEWSRHFKIPAEFHSQGLKEADLTPETEINLYRIAQEALNNTSKHAQAANVSVLLEGIDHRIVLIVEDDGMGFDLEEKADRSKGLGLLGMAERAALVGGNLEVESTEGEGTTVYVRVPAAINSEES